MTGLGDRLNSTIYVHIAIVDCETRRKFLCSINGLWFVDDGPFHKRFMNTLMIHILWKYLLF